MRRRVSCTANPDGCPSPTNGITAQPVVNYSGYSGGDVA